LHTGFPLVPKVVNSIGRYFVILVTSGG